MLRHRVEIRVPSDQILLEQTRAGNQEAFGELINRHYRACYDLASFILRDRSDAQDAVQDAMARALTHLYQYRQEAPFSTWLMRIVVNYCLMHIRARKRVQFVRCDIDAGLDDRPSVHIAATTPDPERQTIDHERHEIVEKEIQLLPSLFRTVLLLHDVHELPLADIAERLQINVGAVKGRLLRARHELKKRVADRYGRNRHLQLHVNGHPAKLRRAPNGPTDHLATERVKSPARKLKGAERESTSHRPIAEQINCEDQERRYSDERPFNSVWLTMREQLAAGAGREVQL
jgi:RNA polymerase sigma-70 factor (ECF subfamily)